MIEYVGPDEYFWESSPHVCIKKDSIDHSDLLTDESIHVFRRDDNLIYIHDENYYVNIRMDMIDDLIFVLDCLKRGTSPDFFK